MVFVEHPPENEKFSVEKQYKMTPLTTNVLDRDKYPIESYPALTNDGSRFILYGYDIESKQIQARYEINVANSKAGGAGHIHYGREISTGKEVALKVDIGLHTAVDGITREVFFHEKVIDMVGCHPDYNVRIYDTAKISLPVLSTVGEVVDWSKGMTPAIIMERIHGHTLKDSIFFKVYGQDFDSQHLLVFGKKLGIIFDDLGRNRVRHKDVKPSNIMLDETEAKDEKDLDNIEIKLIDYGISAFQSEENNASYVLGTPTHMSPEGVIASDQVDAELEYVHHLATIMFEVISGVPPYYWDRSKSAVEVMQDIFLSDFPNSTHEALMRSALKDDDLTQRVLRVFETALKKDPRDRQGSCRIFMEELEEAFK